MIVYKAGEYFFLVKVTARSRVTSGITSKYTEEILPFYILSPKPGKVPECDITQKLTCSFDP